MTKAEIQLVRALQEKRTRDEEHLFVAEGEKLIEEICASGLRVHKIFALEDRFAGPHTETVSRKDMERLSLLKTPSKALALVEIPRHKAPRPNNNELMLALDEVQNPGNLGTIIRLADWFGIKDVICSKTSADCFNPKVVQATMGAILRVRVHYVDLPAFLQEAAAQKTPIYGTFLEGDNLYERPLSKGGIIVMGNEGRGISEAVAEHITDKLFIPPFPLDLQTSESLNVAMATGIICAEFRRRAAKA